MNFVLPIQIPRPARPIAHTDRILSIGSCFTEHIGGALQELKFNVMQNPSGILFDPLSVCETLTAGLQNDLVLEADLFRLQGIWHHWQYHSRFSGPDPDTVLREMNEGRAALHRFLPQADWLIITLGSAFRYRLAGSEVPARESAPYGVANCHRAPASWFRKELMPIEEMVSRLDNLLHRLFYLNGKVEVIFTISPVRHIRDGVVENNRSKARLLETVHHLVQKFSRLHYFPSYELVIDVLRDYRFYDIDLVHPNFAATRYVLDQFLDTYCTEETRALLNRVSEIVRARKHRPSHPETEEHRKFLRTQLQRAEGLKGEFPYLALEEEMAYFRSGL